jgi:hypothetical protein
MFAGSAVSNVEVRLNKIGSALAGDATNDEPIKTATANREIWRMDTLRCTFFTILLS